MTDPLDEAISRSLRTGLSEFPSPDPAVLAEALESRRNTVGRHRRPVVALVAATAVIVTALTIGVVLLSGDDAGRDIVASRGRSAPTRANWTQLPVDGVPRMSGMSTAVLGSRLVVAGTVSGTLEEPPRGGAVELEVGSQRWAELPAPPLGRFEMVGAGDHLVIVGVTAVDDDSVVSWATWRDGAQQWSAPMPLPPTAVTATRDALLEPTGISRRFEGTEMVWTGTHVIDTHYGVALDPDTAMAEPLAVPSDDLTPYMHLNGGTPVWTGDAVVLSTWSKGPGLAWSSDGRSVTEVPGLPDALVTGPVGLTTAAAVDGTVVISTGLADPSAQFAVLDPDRAGWEPLSAPPDPTDPLCGWRLAVVSGKVAAQGCAGAPAGYGDVWLLDSKTWTNAGAPPDPLACCSEHSWTGTDSELFVAGQSTARPRRGSENEAPDPAFALMTMSGG